MDDRVRVQVPLLQYTTLKTGGSAAYLITVTTIEELETAVRFAQAKRLPFFVIGSGSNLLAPDAGYEGIVIHMAISGRTYSRQADGSIHATFGAGEMLDAVIADTVLRGYWGLENLSAIPGTVGATPVQNVGAYGVEVSDCILEVMVVNTDTMERYSRTNDACEFSYRDSCFKKNFKRNEIITHVTFILTTLPSPKISYADLARVCGDVVPTQTIIRQAIIKIRSEKFPDWTLVGTAGSFFKNPIIKRATISQFLLAYPEVPVYDVGSGYVKVSLGYILDKVCNLKGFSIGPVRLYEHQALVLVASVGATSDAIEFFADTVANIVKEKTGLLIEREVTKIE